MIPIKYTYRSLFERRSVVFMTLGSIGFVVLVYIGVLALAGGLRAAFAQSGDPSTVIVLRDGTRSEMESTINMEDHRLLAAMPGVAEREGVRLASGETVTIQIFERTDGTEANVVVRGVEQAAFLLRPGFRMVQGRRFEPGRGEIVVGRALASRLGLHVGDERKLGRTSFRVVGAFAGAGAHDSEIWGDARELGDSFRRGGSFSATRLKASSRGAAVALMDEIEGDQRLEVAGFLETEYFERQTQAASSRFIVLGNVLAILMAFGACFAAANTMYAQISVRAHEIGTLRALGFQRRSIMGCFFLEAVLLGLLAGGFGALLSLPLNVIQTGTMNQVTFSEITFQLRTTPEAIFSGVFLATATGILGGVLPAFSASRRKITDLLREA
ncbi:MAG: FtsX-like permease family protein [Chloroflexi bacterium]|nr:FtsX-like permease family protein [Chloroflexota bacterium]